MSTSRSSHHGHRTSAGSRGSREGKDYTQDPAYISQRRTLIRRYHPDHGGDAQVFIRKLDELDREWAARSAPTPRPATPMGANWDRAQDIARRHTDAEGHLDAGAAAAAAVAVSGPTARRMVKRIRRVTRRTTRAVRTHLPKRMPGAVRYVSTSTRPR